MDEKDVVLRVAFESALMHVSKANKRLTIICIILVVALILSNLAWVIYENQFEVVEETTEEFMYDVQQEASGERSTNNFIGRDGTINECEADGKG